MPSLTLAQARRTAIAAQGLAGAPGQARPAGEVNLGHLQRLIDRIGLLQIDSVNVLARAHLLPVLARLGPYDISLLDRATRGTPTRPRRLVESWAHVAAFVPPQTYQRVRWRVARRHRAWYERLRTTHAEEFGAVVRLLTERGPMTAAQVHEALGHEARPKVNWGWNWTLAKEILEAGFINSAFASAHRTRQFERAYDLPERVLPPDVHRAGAPEESEAVIDLIDIAARAQGVAGVGCLADYFRLSVAHTKRAIAHLVAVGRLTEVTVEGWSGPLYLHAEAHVPRRTHGRALLAPFDPLVFERRRLQALFGMHYRIEIYTPAPRRQYGYYVLPFLLGEQIVARVDLKADRDRGALVVRSAFAEAGAPPQVARELAAEFAVIAQWLDLGVLTVADEATGDLIADVRRAV